LSYKFPNSFVWISNTQNINPRKQVIPTKTQSIFHTLTGFRVLSIESSTIPRCDSISQKQRSASRDAFKKKKKIDAWIDKNIISYILCWWRCSVQWLKKNKKKKKKWQKLLRM
ncbi:hypothetical protein C5167_031393, partial [Papaver somniferum]